MISQTGYFCPPSCMWRSSAAFKALSRSMNLEQQSETAASPGTATTRSSRPRRVRRMTACTRVRNVRYSALPLSESPAHDDYP